MEREDEFDVVQPPLESTATAVLDDEEELDLDAVTRCGPHSDDDEEEGLHWLPTIPDVACEVTPRDDVRHGPPPPRPETPHEELRKGTVTWDSGATV